MNGTYEHPSDTSRGSSSPLGGVSNPSQGDQSKPEELREGPHPITGAEPTDGPRRT